MAVVTKPAEGASTPGTGRGVGLTVEQSVLGALLFDNRLQVMLVDLMQPEDFFEPFHGRVFAEIIRLIGEGRLAEPLVLADRLAKDPAFEPLGGLAYLADLVDRAASGEALTAQVESLQLLALGRQMVRLSRTVAGIASSLKASRYAVEGMEQPSSSASWIAFSQAGAPAPASSPLLAGLVGNAGDLDVDAVASVFNMTQSQLAETAGLSRDTLSKAKRRTAAKTRSRLLELLEIISRIETWAGGKAQAMAWYRAQPIPALGDRTAEALVKTGQASLVRDYLDHIALGGFA